MRVYHPDQLEHISPPFLGLVHDLGVYYCSLRSYYYLFMRVEEGFQQPPFELLNGYSQDVALPGLLKRLLPSTILPEIEQDLKGFGDDLNGSIRHLASLVDPPNPGPTLTQYDQWGKRVDILHTSEGWRRLKQRAAEEGLISIAYERKYGQYSRIYMFVKNMMFASEGRMVGCPLGMTDGCARVMELLGTPSMKENVYTRLISRDPQLAFSAGQFMTERPGGSDVSQTETNATPVNDAARSPGSKYLLNGFKWFSSATDGEVALVLARTGDTVLGARSLSLFLLPLRLPLVTGNTPTPLSILPRTNENNNGILVHRLKHKFGTHPVPTAELSLNCSEAYLVGPLNQGVKSIATVLQLSRIHSSFASAGFLSRALSIARSFAQVRRIDAGSRALDEVPLHVSTLSHVCVLYTALLHLNLSAVVLLGKLECGTASTAERARFRLLNPTVKAFAAHHACAGIEECMAALGGQGYMEENDIGRMLRDAMVEKIWEGTINVLGLDLVRAVQKEQGAVAAWVQWAQALLADAPKHIIPQSSMEVVKTAIKDLPSIFAATVTSELLPRATLLLFGHTSTALSLLEHATWAYQTNEPESETRSHMLVFTRWVEEFGLQALLEDCERLVMDVTQRIRDDQLIVYRRDGESGRATAKL